MQNQHWAVRLRGSCPEPGVVILNNFDPLLARDPYVEAGFLTCVGCAIWQSCEREKSNIYICIYSSNVQCLCHVGAHGWFFKSFLSACIILGGRMRLSLGREPKWDPKQRWTILWLGLDRHNITDGMVGCVNFQACVFLRCLLESEQNQTYFLLTAHKLKFFRNQFIYI